MTDSTPYTTDSSQAHDPEEATSGEPIWVLRPITPRAFGLCFVVAATGEAAIKRLKQERAEYRWIEFSIEGTATDHFSRVRNGGGISSEVHIRDP